MGRNNTNTSDCLYLGIDVGGTKIQISLVRQSGLILGRLRRQTPPGCPPEEAIELISRASGELLTEHGLERGDIRAAGLAVAGIVDPDAGRIVITANMNLSGMAIVEPLQAALGVPVTLGNDTNLGVLGEKWLGAARRASSVFGMFVGTGIGGGMIFGDLLWQGYRQAGGEIGHMVMEIDGPHCGCGKHGCLEALASRWAIQRDIQQAIKRGVRTAVTSLAPEGDYTVIRSGVLRKALDRQDKLVCQVVRRAAEYIGHACVNIRNVIDPEVIVLGGGVIEACGEYILPIIQKVVDADPFPGARPGGWIRLAALGDDSVVLGAVALAQMHVGADPFAAVNAAPPEYPTLSVQADGAIVVGDQVHGRHLILHADGIIEPNDQDDAVWSIDQRLKAKQLARICRGGPEIIYIGHLALRAIEVDILQTSDAIAAYNQSTRRRAAVLVADERD